MKDVGSLKTAWEVSQLATHTCLLIYYNRVPIKGRTCRTTLIVSNKPTSRMSCGARKRQKTMQSRYEIGPRIIFRQMTMLDLGVNSSKIEGFFFFLTRRRYEQSRYKNKEEKNH